MSTTTSVSSSSDIAYATQIAQAASLKRSLNAIGSAIEKGDLAEAGTKLEALAKANPQYSSSSGGAATASNPINQGFKAVSDAIAKNDQTAAKSAWAQLKTNLADSGIKNISDGTSDTAVLLAETAAAADQAVLGAMYGSGSDGQINMLKALIGSGTISNSSTTDSVSSVVSSWLTYQATGASSPTDSASGGILNTIA